MSGFRFVHRERVRYRDVDAWGHVNNAVYATYLEQARMAYLGELGLLSGIDEARMILARLELDFRSPLRAGEEVEIGCRPGRVGTKSFVLEHDLRAGSRVVAEASTVLVAYDYERGETIPLPPAWRAALAPSPAEVS